MVKGLLVVILLALSAATADILGQGTRKYEECGEDYSPCTCIKWISGNSISCINVPTVDLKEIFRRTNGRLFSIDIQLAEEPNLHIPANLLNGRDSPTVTLVCPTLATPLTADSGAFGVPKTIRILGCDMSQINYDDLFTSFTDIESLSFFRSSGIRTLPNVRSDKLRTLQFSSISDLTNLADLGIPLVLSGLWSLTIQTSTVFRQWDATADWSQLEYLSLFDNQMDGETVEAILESLLAVTASGLEQNRLSVLNLSKNRLTRIPPQIRSFSQLNRIRMAENNISIVHGGSFNFRVSVSPQGDYPGIDLAFNTLTNIEPDAFQGNFSFANIKLDNNILTTLDSSVFRSVLEMMTHGDRGEVNIYTNPIRCDCNLEWLLREDRHLIPYVTNGECSNLGRPLSSITLEEFEEICPKNGVPHFHYSSIAAPMMLVSVLSLLLS